MNRNPAIRPNSLYSLFMMRPCPPSSARPTGARVGVERFGRRRELGLADALQGFRGAEALLAGGDELRVLVRGDRPQLEVHHRVEGAAELGAAADVGARPVDRDLELVLQRPW